MSNPLPLTLAFPGSLSHYLHHFHHRSSQPPSGDISRHPCTPASPNLIHACCIASHHNPKTPSLKPYDHTTTMDAAAPLLARSLPYTTPLRSSHTTSHFASSSSTVPTAIYIYIIHYFGVSLRDIVTTLNFAMYTTQCTIIIQTHIILIIHDVHHP